MANTQNTEVAEKKSTAVAAYDDSLLSAGTGLEEATTEDYAIPFIRLLQPMSPQLNKNSGNYIEGAAAGDLINTVSGEVYDGDKGISVVPCAYSKKYIEWIPREKGGGLVDANHDMSILKSCKSDEQTRRYYLQNGNEIVETAQFFVLVTEPDPQQALITMTSTQLGVARKWLTMLRMARVKNSAGASVQAPMFAFTYRLGTSSMSNDKGTWNVFTVNQEGQTDLDTAMVAKEFMSSAKQGDVEVKHEQDGTVTKTNGEAEEAPF